MQQCTRLKHSIISLSLLCIPCAQHKQGAVVTEALNFSITLLATIFFFLIQCQAANVAYQSLTLQSQVVTKYTTYFNIQ